MTYDIPPPELFDLIQTCLEEYHKDLHQAGVTIDAMFAFNDKAQFPVKVGGYPALAYTKITPLKQRVKGMSDAEIVIDGEAYNSISPMQQKALIDRELYSLELTYDKEGILKRDDCERPKLKLKKVDYRLSWYKEIAERHGVNSPEIHQANILWNNDGKTFFRAAQNV